MFKLLVTTSLAFFVIAVLILSVGCQTPNGRGSYGGSDGHFGHSH